MDMSVLMFNLMDMFMFNYLSSVYLCVVRIMVGPVIFSGLPAYFLVSECMPKWISFKFPKFGYAGKNVSGYVVA